MGKLWQSGDGVDLANLNSPNTFDARVSPSVASTTGSTFATVDDAIAAGKHSIYVEAGAYAAGFTVSSPDTYIFCGTPAAGAGGYTSAVFGSPVNITAHYVTIVNAHRVGGAAAGFLVNRGLAGVRLVHCQAATVAGVGFLLNKTVGTASQSYDCHLTGCLAIGNTAGGDGFYWDDSDCDYDWRVTDCTAINNARDGFCVGPTSAVAVAATNKVVNLSGCVSWGNIGYGLRCGSHNSVCILGGTYRNNGINGVYIGTQSSSMARSQIIGARCRYNTGINVALQTATNALNIVGVQTYGGGGTFQNHASCPGFGQTIAIGALATSPNVPAAAYVILPTNNSGV